MTAFLSCLIACQGNSVRRESDELSGNINESQCGFEIVEPPPGPSTQDPCTDGPGVVTVFGPEAFVRSSGSPVTETSVFDVESDGTFCIRVLNDGVSSATLSIDGDVVLDPSVFNPHVAVISRRPDLAVGPHTLDVQLASKPGSSLSVEIRHVPGGVEPDDAVVGDEELVTVRDLFDDPDPFVPGDDTGLPDATVMGVTITALATPGAPSGQFRYVGFPRFSGHRVMPLCVG